MFVLEILLVFQNKDMPYYFQLFLCLNVFCFWKLCRRNCSKKRISSNKKIYKQTYRPNNMTTKFEDMLINISKRDEDESTFLTKKEWREKKVMNGAKMFKHEALGLFKTETLKSLDEMGKLLCKMKITSTIYDGKKLIPSLIGKEANYSRYEIIKIDKVENKKGKTLYRIKTIQDPDSIPYA